MRENDEALIAEALGLKPKRQKQYDNLDKDELKYLLSKGETLRGSDDIQRVQGLGAAPAKFHDHIERLSSVEKEIIRMKTGGKVEDIFSIAPGSSGSSGDQYAEDTVRVLSLIQEHYPSFNYCMRKLLQGGEEEQREER